MADLTEERVAELERLTREPPIGDVAYDLLAFELADRRADISALCRSELARRADKTNEVPNDG